VKKSERRGECASQAWCMCVCLCVLNLKVFGFRSPVRLGFGNRSGHRGHIGGLSMSLSRKVSIWKFHDRACIPNVADFSVPLEQPMYLICNETLPMTIRPHLVSTSTLRWVRLFTVQATPMYCQFLSATPTHEERGSQYPKQMM
jgi:hypothetical protein